MTETKTGIVTEIKKLDPNAKSIDANGKKYIVHDDVVEEAYEIMDNLMIEMATGGTSGQLVTALGKIITAMDSTKFYTASTVAYNALSVAERIDQGIPHPMLRIFTLFVRPQGSDIRVWNEAEAIEWLKDFNAEGYGINSLFNAAALYSKVFIQGSLPNSPNTSEE